MAKKRGNGEGSIHKRPNGTWEAQASVEGRRISRTFKTQRECQEWLFMIRGQIDDGLTYASTKVKLGEFLAGWLTSTKTSKAISTWKHYEQITRTYIIPCLGETKVRELRPEHIQAFYNHLYERDVGIHAIRKCHLTLHCALQLAVKTGMISRNPASYATPPKEPATEIAILSELEISRLLLATQGHRWEALFMLAISSGARQMELLGLKWTDLDWNRRTLKIERQLLRPNGNGVGFSTPKTKYGKRSINLGSKTLQLLRLHYDQQQIERLAAEPNWQEYGLIFSTSRGTPIHPRNLVREFKKLLSAAGLPSVKFHCLRHSCASMLLNQGVPVLSVSRRLGHSRASITLDVYAHLLANGQNDLGETIDDLVIPVPIQLDKNAIAEG